MAQRFDKKTLRRIRKARQERRERQADLERRKLRLHRRRILAAA